MLAASVPDRFPIPFANGAAPPYIRPIPTPSQGGGAASLTDGFPSVNMTPLSAGGIPPFGADMNGILKQITSSTQYQQAGAAFPYDSAFSTAIGGYPIGSLLATTPASAAYWVSLVDNNTSNPDAGGANWVRFDPSGTAQTGDVKFRPTSEALQGWVPANGLTLGNASSNATGLASAAAAALFAWLWNNFSATQCPMFTSSGVPTSRGANPAADFAAARQITLLDWRGTGFMGVDVMGGGATTRLSGVPVILGSTNTAGSLFGENLHSLIANENGPHAHSYTDPTHQHTSPSGIGVTTLQPGGANIAYPTGVSVATSFSATGITIQSAGLGNGHNTVARSYGGYVYLKL